MKQPGTVVDYASVNSLIMKCRPPNTHTHTHGSRVVQATSSFPQDLGKSKQ